MPVAAAVGGTVLGGVLSSRGAKSAAKTQANAADRASQVQQEMHEQMRQDLDPFRQAGTDALGRLVGMTGSSNSYRGDPFQFNGSNETNYNSNPFMFNGGNQYTSEQYKPSEFNFKESPGYQFRKQQGMDGIQSSAAASGGLLSGATLKALNNHNSNLASQEYNNAFNQYQADENRRYNQYLGQEQLNQSQQGQAFNQYLQNEGLRSGQHQQAFQNWQSQDNNAYSRHQTDQNNQYNRLWNLVGMGQNAAAQQGAAGMQTGQAVANNTMAAGNAQAAGQVGSTNALADMIGGVGSSVLGGYENYRKTGRWTI